MRLFIGLLVYNLLLVLTVFYAVFFTASDIKMHYLKDVGGKTEEEAILALDEYQVAVEYVESNNPKSTVLYSSPRAGELVYENQMITLYISKGFFLKRYQMLENQIYDDVKDYLKNLITTNQIELIITYKTAENLLDGLIYQQISADEFIDEQDTLELVVISNPKTVKIPNFVGWYYKDVLKYAQDNKININFEYIEVLYTKDYVVGQSVSSGSLVLKNSNPITIYLAKEN